MLNSRTGEKKQKIPKSYPTLVKLLELKYAAVFQAL